MKIAIDARILYTSTGRYVERLLHHLQEIDRDNQYVVLLLKKDFDRWQPTAPNFAKAVADFPIYSIREQIQFALLLYRLRADLVHFTMPQQPLLYFGRRVTTVHDLTLIEVNNRRQYGNPLKALYKNDLKPLVFKFILRWVTAFSKFIITPTDYVKNHLENWAHTKEAKIIRTYEAVDALSDIPRKPDFMEETDQFIMFLGNAYPYKNVWRLIEAFHALGRPDLKLVLVGKKEFFYAELERRTADAGITGVVFAGFVADEGTAWLNQHATAFITASLSEGFCLPGLEAMYYGTPVLSSNASCLPEVYGPAADYFNPLDVADITRVVGGLLDNPARQAELRAAGPEWIKRYSWEKMARETLEVYRSAKR
jgi:glycosyltransferase involved in cell wall biosynthesis